MATNAGLRPANSSSAASSADADSAERGGHSSKETKRPAPMRSETVATRAAYPGGCASSTVSATAIDGALPLDGDVGHDARDNSYVEVTEVLDFVLDLDAGLALALTLLLADAPRLALLAHLRLAVQLCERRLLFPSQG